MSREMKKIGVYVTKEIHDQIKKNLKTLERLTGLSMMLDEWEVRYEKIKNKPGDTLPRS